MKEQDKIKTLDELRREIDAIDTELVALFSARMQVSSDVAAYKRQTGMAVTDSTREAALLARVAALSPADTADYTRTLYSNILALSRAYQHVKLGATGALATLIDEARKSTPKALPEVTDVACQGAIGAYSQKAAEMLFSSPVIHHYAKFSDVFHAIERGECRYGVLPIENSTAGSVTEIYDLMAKHRFYIVGALKLKVEHCLLAKRGVTLENITEVVSHRQALMQCAEYLDTLPSLKQTAMENTATAAAFVANAPRGVAAIADRRCAALYDLEVLAEGISDNKNNRTRFICISKIPEIYEGADKTSVIMTIPHKPGSLSRILARFDALSVNLTKLESRPIPHRDFEFRFYFDLLSPADAPTLAHLLSELSGESEEFRYLGTYKELE